MQVDCLGEVSRYASAPAKDIFRFRIEHKRISIIDLEQIFSAIAEYLARHHNLLHVRFPLVVMEQIVVFKFLRKGIACVLQWFQIQVVCRRCRRLLERRLIEDSRFFIEINRHQRSEPAT
ncbi:hypothetical protein BHL63_17455 [Xanthomonas alfalfae]|nr:hypothetical protein BHL63_17455 [Xanthomonas alfalfae]